MKESDKIIDVIKKEAEELERAQKEHDYRFGIKFPSMPLHDRDYIDYPTKVLLLKQVIRTIEAMQKRGEL